ncbi:MAG: polysaccharide pyruvyl transferase family protein [Hyphomicrobium sp.]
MRPQIRRALVAGWFSFANNKATYGDVACKDVVCSWLADLNIPTDVGGNPENGVDGIDVCTADPHKYDIFIFVCGPWFPHWVLDRFSSCLKIGVNLSVPVSGNNGFDVLFYRDSPAGANPDLALVSKSTCTKKPFIGVALVHQQPMFGERQRHERVRSVVHEYLREYKLPWVQVDTLLTNNETSTNTVEQFEAVLKRVDVLVSSRLHGLVFAIKNNVPVVAIDAIAGGAKVTAQTQALNWPHLLDGDTCQVEDIARHVDMCMNGETQKVIARALTTARERLDDLRKEFDRTIRCRL